MWFSINKASFLPAIFFYFLTTITLVTPVTAAPTVKSKILAVMSYHQEYQGEIEVRKGIDATLPDATIKYFYLDTKKHPERGKQRAKEAFALYKQFQPEAVIAANDSAQAMFVVPYLKGKTTTPVIFCGVNDEATKYGYPTAHITGILEKKHFQEGISLAQLIKTNIRRIAVIYNDNRSNAANIAQINGEKANYPAKISEIIKVTSMQETMAAIARLKDEVDALLLLNLTGIIDSNQHKLEGPDVLSAIIEVWPKPTIAASTWEVKSGVLCGVTKLGREQGTIAARMAKDILLGKNITDIPITQNRNGQRMINLTTAAKLGIKLKPMVLLGTELIK